MDKGNDRRFYITDANGSSFTWLEGEQNNSLSRSAETLDVSDKSTAWAQVLAGRKSATADVTVNLDDTATAKQHEMLSAFHNGSSVYCFVGTLGNNSEPSVGDMFQAIITNANDTNDKDAVASRQFTLQVSGAITHYPAIS